MKNITSNVSETKIAASPAISPEDSENKQEEGVSVAETVQATMNLLDFMGQNDEPQVPVCPFSRPKGKLAAHIAHKTDSYQTNDID